MDRLSFYGNQTSGDRRPVLPRLMTGTTIVLMVMLLSMPLLRRCKNPNKPDTKPPKVTIIGPEDDFIAASPIRIITSASDNREVQKVVFYVDDQAVGEVYNPPYIYILNVGFWADGATHLLKAEAIDGSDNRTESDPVRITIPSSAFITPYITAPRNKQVLKHVAEIPLKWKGLTGATGYTVAIAKDRDFQNIVRSYMTTDMSMVTERLPIGHYFWAVAARNATGNWSKWSVMWEFSVEPPATPRLAAPKHKFYYKSTDTPQLRWHPSTGASRYEVRVYKLTNREFTEFTTQIEDTFVTVPSLEEGWHLWTVRPRNRSEINGEWSKERQFYTCDPEITDFVKVPAGEFTYGREGEIMVLDYEFEIMKYPVTCRQYLHFLNQAYCREKVDKNGTGYYNGDEFNEAGFYKYADIKNLNKAVGDIIFDDEKGYFVLESTRFLDHPVGDVSWFGANAFARWYGLSLPNEYEWEKTARGKTGNEYPWGNDIDCQNANIAGCKERGFSYSTVPVGQYNGQGKTQDSPSPYGAYDMCGNVWEWTDAWFGGNFQAYRVIRGGSYYETKGTKSGLENLKSWYRYWRNPKSTSGKYDSGIGFRCILRKK